MAQLHLPKLSATPKLNPLLSSSSSSFSMSCISLKLLPPRKAWKSLTSTFAKLRKMHKSKAIKKARKHKSSAIASPATKPCKLFRRRFRCKKLTIRSATIYGFHKKSAPVYIDKLFEEPACDLVENMKPQIVNNERIEKKKALKIADEPLEEEGTSTSDDIWESVRLGSPMVQDINERAEEFIARIKREMAQEMLASNL